MNKLEIFSSYSTAPKEMESSDATIVVEKEGLE